MATYKVIQDVEAEDKLVGPLTLRQFIYAGIAAISGYLGFLLTTKGAGFMLVVFVPIMLVCGFFAFPWGRDQPTEIWALAKIRFLFKPRKRIWDQSGVKDLVTVTAPKHVERNLTNGLNQEEVQSRLNALASTIDSRGWAVKNVNVSMGAASAMLPLYTSDRLVQASSLPQEVSNVDVRPSDDILDETANPVAQHFDSMIQASSAAHRAQLIDQMQQPQTMPSQAPAAVKPPTDYWFMNQPAPAPAGQSTFVDVPVVVPGAQALPAVLPQAATPTEEEEALVEKFKAENSSLTAAYGRMKTVKTPQQLADEARQQAAAQAIAKPPVTPDRQAAIINLANDNDKNVATIARQAHQEVDQGEDGEVVISLR